MTDEARKSLQRAARYFREAQTVGASDHFRIEWIAKGLEQLCLAALEQSAPRAGENGKP